MPFSTLACHLKAPLANASYSKKEFEYTIIVYESCHRIVKFLNELIEILGEDRRISVSRELTKLHEAVHTDPRARCASA